MDSHYAGYDASGAWNTGATNSQRYDGYDYSYTQDNIPCSDTNYGYNAGSNTWEPPKNVATDTIIAKINQRLDMLSQLETENQTQEEPYQETYQESYQEPYQEQYQEPYQESYDENRYFVGRQYKQEEEYAPYESYDSRSSLNDQDLYRSGYGYSEYGPNRNDSYGGRYDHYDSSYETRHDPYQNRRDLYGPSYHRGQNWSRDRPPYNRANRNDPFMSPGSGRMSARWNELSMGGRGPNAAPARNLPSLFSPNIIPMDLFRGQGSGRPLGGGRQRRRERIRGKVKGVNNGGKTIGFGRKRKQSTNSPDEPDSKYVKTEDGDGSDAEDDGDGDESGDGAMGEDKEYTEREEKKPKRFPTMQERKKLNKPKKNRDRLAERIMYACSVCKFRTFEDEEINTHMDSKFHKETFTFIGTKLENQAEDFLHEYIVNKVKKTQKRREKIGDKTILKKQLMQHQDLLQDVGLEHFMKKVEATHCVACDLFVPMQFTHLMRHLRTPQHCRNRKGMLERAKKGSLVVAKSILNNRNISTMLEKYNKGENPFTDDDPEKEDDEDGDGAGEGGEGAGEGAEGGGEVEGAGEGADDDGEAEGVAKEGDGEVKEATPTDQGEKQEEAAEGNASDAEAETAEAEGELAEVQGGEGDSPAEPAVGGKGAGAQPEMGKEPAEESLTDEEDEELLEGGDEEDLE
ncbi:A-kinase anchor protein 8-like [Callorhinchus milii]|uniref:A-kinase anchor protein 8-like n=1 Tax=Callorhinchus milii TaxID=7868 RepID=UPI001C3FEFD9|nr:A-kinase anchor protein 8-like [Callorhinchus milii]